MKVIRDHPIRAFAVLFVAVISAFVMWMRYRQLEVLFSPDWCNRAMKAEQLDAGSRLDAALACVGLQRVQLGAVANNSYIDGGTIALCLLTLIVIVIAKGKVEAEVGPKSARVKIGEDFDGTPPTPVVVTNPASNPVPTTEAPKPPLKPPPTSDERG